MATDSNAVSLRGPPRVPSRVGLRLLLVRVVFFGSSSTFFSAASESFISFSASAFTAALAFSSMSSICFATAAGHSAACCSIESFANSAAAICFGAFTFASMSASGSSNCRRMYAATGPGALRKYGSLENGRFVSVGPTRCEFSL